MTTDLTFITNEHGQSLKDRFEVLIKDSRFFDCLVGYFFTSGFYAVYRPLEKTEKIRILIGISTDRRSYDLMSNARNEEQLAIPFSHAETKQEIGDRIVNEMAESEDKSIVEEGVIKFIEWIRSKKLEIRAYPSQNLHAKLYIMTFVEGDRDKGRVITGSSNFTEAGLCDNLEFNVELKNRADYEFAKNKFEELWKDSVEVNDKYIETIETRTWLNPNIPPYLLYLKFLYEYFKDELGTSDELFTKYLPENFMRLEYQEQAVLNSKKILEEYGGVFISDVVGLGKTYIATMLADQIDGRTLVIAPPALLDEKNPGSWKNAFSDFKRHAFFKSVGMLDDILEEGTERYKNVIIDEAHRFRNEDTVTYEKLAEICRGKRVILVTATPYNNSPMDILSQLKLFQKSRRSTIPNLPDIESFFRGLVRRLKGLDRQKDRDEYIRIVRENSKEIREKVLKYLMVRRTRTEITKYFSDDLQKQKLRFPEVENPEPLYYELNEKEDEIFTQTIEIVTRDFRYARYTPLLYYKGTVDPLAAQSQRNMQQFMKGLLVKRLESSFHAFRNSIDRFIYSYERYIREIEKGNVYVSSRYFNKIFDLLEEGNDEKVQLLIDSEKAERYDSNDFSETFIEALKNDFNILNRIRDLWQGIHRDPKLLKFIDILSKDKRLREGKVIIFTESKETAEYLAANVGKAFEKPALLFTGDSDELTRDRMIENFDAKARRQKDDYRILITTEVLSEGVNLHRSNIVINYDIPWNPTRMMQRVGRINRVDTKFDRIYTFNFFPTKQSNDEIKLKEAAEAKINAFLTLLGGDAALLTEGEPIGSHELFNRLFSKKTITGEDDGEESELKYLQVIKTLRDENPDLFEKIKRLPRKSRSAKAYPNPKEALLTYFRRGKLQKFFTAQTESPAKELDFMAAAAILESNAEEKKQALQGDFYSLLNANKEAFLTATAEETSEPQKRRGRDSERQILVILRATMSETRQLTDDQELYVKKIMRQLEEGGLPKQTAKSTLKALGALKEAVMNPLRVIAVLQSHIPGRFLDEHYAENSGAVSGKREVILSMYLTGE
jgi:superfamily II DNA/RNA helicase